MQPYVNLAANVLTFMGFGAWSIPGTHIFAKFTGETTANFSFMTSTMFFLSGLLIHTVAWYTVYWDCKRNTNNE